MENLLSGLKTVSFRINDPTFINESTMSNLTNTHSANVVMGRQHECPSSCADPNLSTGDLEDLINARVPAEKGSKNWQVSEDGKLNYFTETLLQGRRGSMLSNK